MGTTRISIGFVGGGQMAEAMVRGILAAGLAVPEQITIAEPMPARRESLAKEYGVTCTQDPAILCQKSEVLVLAVKPQLAATVLAAYRPLVDERHLVFSIMAGVTLRALAEAFSVPVRLIRVMPNTPALVLAGAAAFSPNDQVTDRDREIAMALFSAVGTCVEVPEHLLDAVTGLSGSGPGYVFAFIEAMIDAGVLAGLPRPVAEQLTVQTVLGSARLAQESGEHPAMLKGRVTSPGGTTIAGLQVLEKGALRGVVMDAVVAATERSRALGG
ncbi:MAG: pyrroline-5-carboxylate reductase [Desulfobulbus sp.]|jgi:pyrroline-5-carboxylate reductase|uniref:pyrroline-5-carboxylate reductase n=1 Tax=Desulfobulbus sp. TaxID=895 RepID=UPI002846E569|nr:pyrroline-5-carboxylate reductase [Desulfobulbus sp.]MDR2549360.1 pyrroline-5-carboxylate reductase [Desulfobulbus sp.]